MSGSVDRRSFLTGGLALLGSSALASCDRAVLEPEVQDPADRRQGPATDLWPVSLHLDHSGSLDGLGHAVVGGLVTPTPALHEEALEQLREQGARYYYRRLTYSSNDRNKLDYARAAIDHLLEAEGLMFQARVIGPGDHGRSGSLLQAYERLIGEIVGVDAEGSVELEPTTSVGLDPELRDHLDGSFGGLSIGGGSPSNLLQLTDLLTGSIYGDVTRTPRRRGTSHPHPRGQSVKDQLITHLRERLDVRLLTHRSLEQHPTFRVSYWRTAA